MLNVIYPQVTISGFDLKDFRQCMKKWNSAMTAMNYQCQELGPSVCLPLYYEQLVLKPQYWMEKLLNFLEVPWNESVLHHEQFVNKPGGISLSKLVLTPHATMYFYYHYSTIIITPSIIHPYIPDDDKRGEKNSWVKGMKKGRIERWWSEERMIRGENDQFEKNESRKGKKW